MWSKLRIILYRMEDGLLLALFISIIGAANTQILLRNLFDQSIVWIDPFLRVTVMWLALMGAMVATRERMHIAIDLFTRYLPHVWCLRMERLIHAIGALVCGIIAYHSTFLVLLEYKEGLIAFAAMPVWLCESIIPIAFAVMAIRFLLQALAGSKGTLDKTALTNIAQKEKAR